MPFHFEIGKISGVLVIEPRVFQDGRGFFMETYKRSAFSAAGVRENFVQDNHSRSVTGTLRGLHFQKAPQAQGKLVRVIFGEVFDVVVDIRPESPTYGAWMGMNLSAKDKRMLYLPPFCAHGFCVVSDVAELVYKTTAEYTPELESGIIWNDPDLKIDWPIRNPILSERDRNWPRFRDLPQ